MARVDPYKNFRFWLDFDNIHKAGFSECTGFGSSVGVIEYRQGGDPSHVRKLPGMTSYPDITLKWGITDSSDLYEWHKKAVDGKIEYQNGSIILLDDLGEEKVRWDFYGAWPSRYDGPDFSAKSNEVAIETLVLSCEKVERK